jgi:IclR family transcriptional regulator, acetate operon repressor
MSLQPERRPPVMTRPLTSVDNALRLMLTLQDGRPMRVTEAAALLGVSRATAHRLLATLEGRHFVEQDPVTRAYLVGVALARNWLPQSMDVFAVAEPEMRSIAAELGASTHLATLNGVTVTIVASVASRRAQRKTAFVGTTFPAHYSAAGQAILADLPLAELEQRYRSQTLRRPGWARTKLVRESETLLWKKLLADLEDVRERGYATNFHSGNRAVNAIACSLRLGAPAAPFALVIDAPSSQTGRRRLLSYAEPLRTAAAHVRTKLARGDARTERNTR